MEFITLTEKEKELLFYVQGLFDKPVYLVGGACRDILLGKKCKDYDFCSEMSTDEVKEQIKGKHKAYCIGEKFGTIGFKCLDEMIEITQFRDEEYATRSRKPEVTFGTDLNTDLSRRDFTINAMALNCKTFKLVDPFNGEQDLRDGIIRAVGSPKLRFKEDPLRILRAIRFATVLDFEIEALTLKKLSSMNYSLMRISRERWVIEFDKILQSCNTKRGLKLLWETRVFNFTIPELAIQWGYDQNSKYHNLQLWEHTAKVVESAQQAGEPIEMLWAALLHDVGKPATRTDKNTNDTAYCKPGEEFGVKSNYIMHERVGAEIALRLCEYLKFSKDRREFVISMIKNHLKDDCPLRIYDNAHKSSLAGELDK